MANTQYISFKISIKKRTIASLALAIAILLIFVNLNWSVVPYQQKQNVILEKKQINRILQNDNKKIQYQASKDNRQKKPLVENLNPISDLKPLQKIKSINNEHTQNDQATLMKKYNQIQLPKTKYNELSHDLTDEKDLNIAQIKSQQKVPNKNLLESEQILRKLQQIQKKLSIIAESQNLLQQPLKQNTLYNIFSATSASICLDTSEKFRASSSFTSKTQTFYRLTTNQFINSLSQQFFIKYQQGSKDIVKIYSRDKLEPLKWVAGLGDDGDFPIIVGEKQIPGEDIYNLVTSRDVFSLTNSYYLLTSRATCLDIAGGKPNRKQPIIQSSFIATRLSRIFVFKQVKDYKEFSQVPEKTLAYFEGPLKQNFIVFQNSTYSNQIRFQAELKYVQIKNFLTYIGQRLPIWTQKPDTSVNQDDLPQWSQIISDNKQLPAYKTFQCPKSFELKYAITDDNSTSTFQNILSECNSIKLLTEKDFQKYAVMWNSQEDIAIQTQKGVMGMQKRSNLLSLLYLYFQSGISSSSLSIVPPTQKCLTDLYTDSPVFTNIKYTNSRGVSIPDKTSWIMSTVKKSQQMRQLITDQIRNLRGDVFSQFCQREQCFIINCGVKKGKK